MMHAKLRITARKEYEQAFCQLVGASHARAFALGRQAMVILLRAIGVKPGDKIGVCSFTCLSVVEAVMVCGAIPVYLDVDDDLCIEPSQVRRVKPGTLKVVILQHSFGIPGQLDDLLSACTTIGAKVIEDCAHSLGCSWDGKLLGTFGEGAIYSFQWGKPYTTGQGGMLTVNSQEFLGDVDAQIDELAVANPETTGLILGCQRGLYSILGNSFLQGSTRYIYHRLRDWGLIRGSFKLKEAFSLTPGYIRLADEMTARAGLKQLRNWPRIMQLRRDHVQMIEDCFNKAGLALWPKPDKADVTMLRYPLLVPDKQRILWLARKHRLDIGGWYISPVHPAKGDDLANLDYHKGSCPRAENAIKELVHLPTGLSLNEYRLNAMVRIICGS